MEKQKIMSLHVKLVPAIDTYTRMPHTSYTVYCRKDDIILLTSDWTLRDVIYLFRELHHIDDHTQACLAKPFRKQRNPANSVVSYKSEI